MTRISIALFLMLVAACSTTRDQMVPQVASHAQSLLNDYVVFCPARLVELDAVPNHPTNPRGRAVRVSVEGDDAAGSFGLRRLASRLSGEMLYIEGVTKDAAQDAFFEAVGEWDEWKLRRTEDGEAPVFLRTMNSSKPSSDYWILRQGRYYLHALDPRGEVEAPEARIPYGYVNSKIYTLLAPIVLIKV